MEVTRITKENADFFSHLCPVDLLQDERMLKLGALSDEDSPMSVCVIDIRDGKAWIRWIYTDPEQRGRGGAAFLLEELLHILQEVDVEGILVDFHENDEGLADFLMDHDFLVGDEQVLFRIPLMDLLYGGSLEKVVARRSKEKRTYSLQNNEVLKPLAQFLISHEVETEFLDGISRKYSFVFMDPSGKVTECVFISDVGNGDLRINYLVGEGSPQGIIDLVAAFYDALIKDERDQGDLIFSDRLGAGISFIDMLTENDIGEYRVPGLMSAVKLFGAAEIA